MDASNPAQAASRIELAVVVLVLLLAATLRLHGIGYGLPAMNDPDEVMFEMGATRMLTGGTLNPGWFGHPATTTMYLLALVNAATFGAGWLTGTYAGMDAFITAIYSDPGLALRPGRIAMAAFAVLTVWLTWRIGRQIGGRMAGLFAALLLACSPVHVTYSQIIRSDMMGTAFMLLCIGTALRVADRGRTADRGLVADYRWAALWLALAVASKWPFGITALAVAGACAWRMTQAGADRKQELRHLLHFAWLAPVLLVVISPHLLLDYDTVLRNLAGESRAQHLGATGGGFFANAWWYLQGALCSGLGLAGLALAAGGLVLLARDRQRGWVILPVLLAQALIICLHGLRWERWAVPLLPLLALAAGLMAAWVVQRVQAKLPLKAAPAWVPVAVLALVPLVLVPPAWAEAEARMHDTRQQATAWGDAHIPPGSTVLVEHFAFDMFDRPWTVLFPLGDAGCVKARDMQAARIDYRAVEAARSGRSTVDYGTVAPATRATCQADFAVLAQMDRYRAEQDHFPAEYGAYQALLRDMEVVATFRPEPGQGAGPVVEVLAARR